MGTEYRLIPETKGTGAGAKAGCTDAVYYLVLVLVASQYWLSWEPVPVPRLAVPMTYTLALALVASWYWCLWGL